MKKNMYSSSEGRGARVGRNVHHEFQQTVMEEELQWDHRKDGTRTEGDLLIYNLFIREEDSTVSSRKKRKGESADGNVGSVVLEMGHGHAPRNCMPRLDGRIAPCGCGAASFPISCFSHTCAKPTTMKRTQSVTTIEIAEETTFFYRVTMQ